MSKSLKASGAQWKKRRKEQEEKHEEDTGTVMSMWKEIV